MYIFKLLLNVIVDLFEFYFVLDVDYFWVGIIKKKWVFVFLLFLQVKLVVEDEQEVFFGVGVIECIKVGVGKFLYLGYLKVLGEELVECGFFVGFWVGD